MALVDWWSDVPTPREAQWALRPLDARVSSAFTGASQAVGRTSLWTCSMLWSDAIRHDDYTKMAGFFGSTGEGFVLLFKVRNFQYRNLVGGVTGQITTNAVSHAGTDSLNVSMPTGTDPRLDRGDLVEVPGGGGEPRLHRVKEPFLAGQTQIKVHPVLRAQVPSSTQVVHRGNRPLECTMEIMNPESVSAPLMPGTFARGFQVTFLEAIRRSF